jgi:hypothetical protein
MTALVPFLGEMIAAESSALGAAGASEMSALAGARALAPSASSLGHTILASSALQALEKLGGDQLSRRRRGNPRRQQRRKPRRNRKRNPNRQAPAMIREVSAPYATGSQVTTTSARVNGNGVVRIRHREYMKALFNASGANVNTTAYAINPGLQTFSPWLSKIAYNFEHYRIKNLKVKFLTSSSTNTRGRMSMGFIPDADSDLVLPETQAELTALGETVSGSVWISSTLNIPSQGWKLVRTKALNIQEDATLYDNGVLVLMVSAGSNTNQIGDIYVEYEVEMKDPVLAEPPQFVAETSAVSGVSAPNNIFGENGPTQRLGSLEIFTQNNVLAFVAPGSYLVVITAIVEDEGAPGQITINPDNNLTITKLSESINGTVDQETRSIWVGVIRVRRTTNTEVNLLDIGASCNASTVIATLMDKVDLFGSLDSTVPETPAQIAFKKAMKMVNLANQDNPESQPIVEEKEGAGKVPKGYHLVRR